MDLGGVLWVSFSSATSDGVVCTMTRCEGVCPLSTRTHTESHLTGHWKLTEACVSTKNHVGSWVSVAYTRMTTSAKTGADGGGAWWIRGEGVRGRWERGLTANMTTENRDWLTNTNLPTRKLLGHPNFFPHQISSVEYLNKKSDGH